MAAEFQRVAGLDPARVEPTTDFEGFFARESTTLFRRLWLVTRDREAAEDLVQEAFIVLLERWNRVGAMDDPTGYLYRVAFNAWRRRSGRAARAARRIAAITTEPRDDFGAAEARTVLGSALDVLTPRQRAALVLTELVGMSSDDAARLLKVRAVTVRVLASQGRAALRARIGGNDA
ncbi:MAG: sigma-70 family RNA polymerase sigma factor [Actinomycetota bacterium]